MNNEIPQVHSAPNADADKVVGPPGNNVNPPRKNGNQGPHQSMGHNNYNFKFYTNKPTNPPKLVKDFRKFNGKTNSEEFIARLTPVEIPSWQS